MQKSSKCTYNLGGIEKKKKKYLRPEEALKAAKKLNEQPQRIHLMSAYKCTTCLGFHVGKSWKTKDPSGIYKRN